MSNRYLPDWLYQALPFVYVGAGVLTLAALKGEIAIFSGLTLISAGAIVWLLRRRIAAPAALARQAESGQGLVEISWRKSYECGHETIDRQHRRLFGLSNELIDALLTKKPKSEIEFLLNEMADHIGDHFEAEEAVLKQSGDGIACEHAELHRALLARTAVLRETYRNGAATAQELVGFIACDVVASHIIEESRNFGAFKQAGPGAAVVAPEPQARDNADPAPHTHRDDPAGADKHHLTVPILDRLTPEKNLFNSYPHVWRRICVFAPEPPHLEKYLDSLTMQDRSEQRAGFSLGALRELADIHAENRKYLPKETTVWRNEGPTP